MEGVGCKDGLSQTPDGSSEIVVMQLVSSNPPGGLVQWQ